MLPAEAQPTSTTSNNGITLGIGAETSPARAFVEPSRRAIEPRGPEGLKP
jgi:hypothetical protein